MLYLGAKNAAIVLKDADLDRAADVLGRKRRSLTAVSIVRPR